MVRRVLSIMRMSHHNAVNSNWSHNVCGIKAWRAKAYTRYVEPSTTRMTLRYAINSLTAAMTVCSPAFASPNSICELSLKYSSFSMPA
ncbi:hypothetical protein BLEM_1873 [Bifidobacterium lemurum]|uniref:Uncharacterized protein n=1 Tax=Bifidobacterium lemurum TaxID=1603886 RepID=A0A261FM07_9BIFI|nr:hypothetical protein BLEM_1873 [Bifidobacterium lemurum]